METKRLSSETSVNIKGLRKRKLKRKKERKREKEHVV